MAKSVLFEVVLVHFDIGVFANKLNLFIYRLLVQLLDFDFSSVVDRLENLLLIQPQRFRLNFLQNLWIFWKYCVVEKLFGEGEAFDVFFHGHVNKLTLAQIDNIMVTNQLVLTALQLLSDVMLVVGHAVGNEVEADADDAFGDEVHF